MFKPKRGDAKRLAKKLQLSGEGQVNDWFIPAVQAKVSYCVVHGSGAGDAHVIGDQYGGCEYHELYNVEYDLLASRHVYRGGGTTAEYTIAQGFEFRSVKRSAKIAQGHGMSGSNWSVSCIDRSTKPPAAKTEFIHVEGYPAIKVKGADDGDTAY